MADSIDYGQLLATLLGLGGAGIGLAGGVQTAGQQQTTYQQNQQLYNLLLNLAQSDANFRQNLSNLLANPQAFAADVQALMNPNAATVENRAVQAMQRNLANQGVTGGSGAHEAAVAEAVTNIDAQMYQQAEQTLLSSLGLAGGLRNTAFPNVPTYIPGTSAGGTQNTALSGALSNLGPLIRSAAQLLGLSPTDEQIFERRVTALLGNRAGGGGSGSLDVNAGGGTDTGSLNINAGGGVDTGSVVDPSLNVDTSTIPYDYGLNY